MSVWLPSSKTAAWFTARRASVPAAHADRKSTRLNSSHSQISYAVFCLKKKKAAMSAGNLHPIEAYVVGDDLSVRHYHPLQHELTTLRPGHGKPVAIWLTAIPRSPPWT